MRPFLWLCERVVVDLDSAACELVHQMYRLIICAAVVLSVLCGFMCKILPSVSNAVHSLFLSNLAILIVCKRRYSGGKDPLIGGSEKGFQDQYRGVVAGPTFTMLFCGLL